MDHSYLRVDSDVGTWTLESDHTGLTRVHMPGQWAPPSSPRVGEVLRTAARQLDDYFSRRRSSFHVRFADVVATPFQRDVWRVVASLPYATVATYAEVAELTGRPLAARAVGNANHANPWPVFVPCHRVVASTGIGGYGGGEHIKRYLLELEGVDLTP